MALFEMYEIMTLLQHLELNLKFYASLGPYHSYTEKQHPQRTANKP